MLASLLTLGSRWTLVGGKGGVGKTTTAAALAVSLADQGGKVLVLSVDPAHSLGDALGLTLGPDPVPVPGVPGLEAMEVSAEREQQRFLTSRRGALLRLLERGTYLDEHDVEGLLDLAVPGMDELAALLRLVELAGDRERQLVIDTAPTGHTLRLLDLPDIARGWLGALQAMEERHRAVSLALAGAYRPDEAGRMLDDLAADLSGVSSLLADPRRARFVLVTNPEPVVLAETGRYRAELERRGIALAGIVVNRSIPAVRPEALGEGMVFIPPLATEPSGPDGLRGFAGSARPTPAAPPTPHAATGSRVRAGEAFAPPLDRTLYLVAGKGGVGKSTAAAALAVLLARSTGGAVHLLSTDPAGSLGEVLAMPVGAEARSPEGVPNLHVRQVDAPARWDEFRREYQEETARLFEGILSGGLSASADQRVIERLLDLAPPGIDELVALLEVVDVTEDRSYDALILDTAPTGHLLRLLELPEVALEWTHALMRLLLKYRDVLRLGKLAERVVRLSRSLRELRARLTDPASTWTLVVALPEALGVAETQRLLARLRELGIPTGAVLVNRALDADGGVPAAAAGYAGDLMALAGATLAAAAPDRDPAPVGAAPLLDFAQSWRLLLNS